MLGRFECWTQGKDHQKPVWGHQEQVLPAKLTSYLIGLLAWQIRAKLDAHESGALQVLAIYSVGAAVRCELNNGVVRGFPSGQKRR